MFDNTYEHGGLVLVATELCLFTKFEGLEHELNTLEKMSEIMPDNTNIQHMIKLRDSIPKFRTSKTDIYCLSSALYLAKRLAIYNLKTALAALPNVQNFFDEIILDREHQSKHIELCALEEKVIFETYMCCEYYLSHTSDTHYNKYQAKL